MRKRRGEESVQEKNGAQSLMAAARLWAPVWQLPPTPVAALRLSLPLVSLNSERHPIVIYAAMQGKKEQNRRRILNQQNFGARHKKCFVQTQTRSRAMVHHVCFQCRQVYAIMKPLHHFKSGLSK